jgi:hypothetical protein
LAVDLEKLKATSNQDLDKEHRNIILPGIENDGGNLSIDFLAEGKSPSHRAPPPPIPAGMNLPLPVSRNGTKSPIDVSDLMPPIVSPGGPPPIPDSAKKNATLSPPPVPAKRRSHQPTNKAPSSPLDNTEDPLVEDQLETDNAVESVKPPPSPLVGSGPPRNDCNNLAPPPPPMMSGPPPPPMSGPPPPPMMGSGPPPPPPPPMMNAPSGGAPKLSLQEQLALKAKARLEREANGEVSSTPAPAPAKPADSMQDQLKARLAKRRQNEVGENIFLMKVIESVAPPKIETKIERNVDF